MSASATSVLPSNIALSVTMCMCGDKKQFSLLLSSFATVTAEMSAFFCVDGLFLVLLNL